MRYYVRKSGSNLNSGLSRTDAWLTLPYAAANISDGDRLIIGAGIYTEDLDLSVLSSLLVFGDILGSKTGDAGQVDLQALSLGSHSRAEFLYSETITISGDGTTLSNSFSEMDISIYPGAKNILLDTCGAMGSVIFDTPVSCLILNSTIRGMGASPLVAGFTQAFSPSLEIYNTILATSGSLPIFDLDIPTKDLSSDYNMYWGGPILSSSYEASIATFDGWTETGNDSSSVYMDPNFLGQTLAVSGLYLGLSLGSPYDIYGTFRENPPGVGAYEDPHSTKPPAFYTLRRFRKEWPLESHVIVDSLSEIQRMFVHYYGETGIITLFNNNLRASMESHNDALPTEEADKILGNLGVLRLRNWL